MPSKTTTFEATGLPNGELWSNPANWSNGIPVDGDSVILSAAGFTNVGDDDIPALGLATLTEQGIGELSVMGRKLTVGTLVGVANLTGVVADDADAQAPVSVTIGNVATPGLNFIATGPGALIADQSATDMGEYYSVGQGGKIVLSGAPASASNFDYQQTGETPAFAFEALGTTTTSVFQSVGSGEVIEVPGNSVSNVTIGPSSLRVITDKGNYAFTHVGYIGGVRSIRGYTAAFDQATGLVALTFGTVDQFQPTVATTGGRYLWSNPANWTGGVPGNGDSVSVGGAGYDDLAALTLASLTLNAGGNAVVHVTGGSLTVTNLAMTGSGGTAVLDADAADPGAPVTVTVQQVAAPGVTLTATGAGADLLDKTPAASAKATSYAVAQGGLVELFDTPLATDNYSFTSSGTFAFQKPAASNLGLFQGVGFGSTIEVPGGAVLGVAFGANTLAITTDVGTYAFNSVVFATPVTNYAATLDFGTLLEAVTFRTADTFKPTVQANAGQVGPQQYFWSNAANWTEGVPINGDSLLTTYKSLSTEYQVGIDDIADLTLSGLNLAIANHVEVDHSLTVGTLTESTNTLIAADSTNSAAPAVLTINAIAGAPYEALIEAYGADATVIDRSPADLPGKYGAGFPGMAYTVEGGGKFELVSAAPAATSQFLFLSSIIDDVGAGDAGTIAFGAPGAVVAAQLGNAAPGDVIELPGTSVSSVAFGANTLTVTTDAGTVAFSNVTYGNPVTGYTAAPDPSTGLVAITFTGPDVFEQNVMAAAGALAGDYLWSNAANWTQGVPVDGESVLIADQTATSYDDLASLSLASLTLNHSDVEVVGRSLTVASVTGGALLGPTTYYGYLQANASTAGTPVTITVGAISGTRSTYSAVGAGATFIDNAVHDPGDTYVALKGGTFVFNGAPADTGSAATDSDFWFDDGGNNAGTIAIAQPTPVTTSDIGFFGAGDTLELPGTKVAAFTLGANTLSVTTDAGTYRFATQGQADAITGYTAAPDPATGLVAVTFTGVDTFSDNVKAASGPLAGDYLWSNAANWSNGVPGDGASVMDDGDAAGNDFDDIAALRLASLSLNGGFVTVYGSSLNAATVIGTSGSTLYAFRPGDGSVGPSTVTIGTITGTGAAYAAHGAGTSLIDRSPTDTGNIYAGSFGGLVELAAAPADTSSLHVFLSGKTALQHPAASTAATLKYIAPGDVLELPGATVASASFGASSFSITTDAGAYAFTNVQYDLPVTGYIAAPDPATGLVSITFTGIDTFTDNIKATSGPLAGDYLWSNGSNWSDGVPINGDAVLVAEPAAVGYDDLSALSLTSLDLNGSTLDVVGSSLDIGTVTGHAGSLDAGILLADSTDAGAPVTVTIGTIADPKPTYYLSLYGATGAGARLVDRSATNYGAFGAARGGVTELSAAPSSVSNVGYAVIGVTDRGPATIALDSPGAVDAARFDIAPGDVLELPGNGVTTSDIEPGSLSITTNSDTYAFSNVVYDLPVVGYTAAPDATTGLLAITFTGIDTFTDNIKATSGPLAGDYLWSNGSNWSDGVPINGDAVLVAEPAAVGYDDLSALSLTSLDLNGSTLDVVGSSLDIGTVTGHAGSLDAGILLADSTDAGAPVTVTIGTIADPKPTYYLSLYGATGAGARLVDRSATNYGAFGAARGGVTELSAAPSSVSNVGYAVIGVTDRGPATIALDSPGAADAARFDIAPGDVLELPGNGVTTSDIEPGSLSITTNSDTYAFSNVVYDLPVVGYTAAPDATTGLLAITFTGIDTFSDTVKASNGPLAGDYLWSNAANWSNGVPVSGDSVVFAAGGTTSVDDLAGLMLSSLTIDSNTALAVTAGHLTIAGALTVGDAGVGILTVSTGAEVTAASVTVEGQGRIVMAGGVLDPPVPIAIAAGGSITGSGTIDGTVVVAGTLAATGGLLTVDGAVSGTGTLAIGAGATLDLEGGAGLTQGGGISFGGPGSKLVVGAGQSVSGGVLGLGSGGEIDFAGQTVTASFAQGVLTLMSGAATVGTLLVGDGAGSAGFTATPDGQGGTDIVAAPSGTAVGDVHLLTFDGLHYDFQADGDFTLARSTLAGNPFDVEIRTTPWTLNHYASLTTQAAAQVGGHAIDFMLDSSVEIDGVADMALGAAHPEQHLSGGTLTALGSDGYQLDWTGGERLIVTNQGFFLNLQTTLSATDGPGSVQGLLGALQGPANDLALPDGTVLTQPVPDATLLGEFADAWRVSPDASLLDGTSLRPDMLGMPTSPSFMLADAPGELLTGSLGSTADTGVVIGGSLANLAGAVIANFAARDFIDVTDLAGASAAFQATSSADSGQLTITDGFHSATLALMGTGAAGAVQYSSDHHGGTLLHVS